MTSVPTWRQHVAQLQPHFGSRSRTRHAPPQGPPPRRACGVLVTAMAITRKRIVVQPAPVSPVRQDETGASAVPTSPAPAAQGRGEHEIHLTFSSGEGAAGRVLVRAAFPLREVLRELIPARYDGTKWVVAVAGADEAERLISRVEAVAREQSMSVFGAAAVRRAVQAADASSSSSTSSSSAVRRSLIPPCHVAIITRAVTTPQWLDLTVAAKVVGGAAGSEGGGDEFTAWAVVPLLPGICVVASRSVDGEPFRQDTVADIGAAFEAWAARVAPGRPVTLVGAGVALDVTRLSVAAEQSVPVATAAAASTAASSAFTFTSLDVVDLWELLFPAVGVLPGQQQQPLAPGSAGAGSSSRERLLAPGLGEAYARLFPGEAAQAAELVAAGAGADEMRCVRALARICEHPDVRPLLRGLLQRQGGGASGANGEADGAVATRLQAASG